MIHYLRTLEHHGLVGFPFKIHYMDRPDFEIDTAGRRLGLEVTEAGAQTHQQMMTELEKAPRGSMLEEDKVRRSGERLIGRGFAGDTPERQWTELILKAVQEKTEKLGSYGEYPEYHLLVYDNTGLAALTAWSVTELPDRLAAALERQLDFSRISVLRDRVLMFDVTGNSRVLPVPPSETQPQLLPLTRLGVSEDDVHAFCRRHHIRKLGFFGSAREDRFGPESDVDVLVEFEPDRSMGLIRLAGLELELGELLGRKADLRTRQDLSRYFRDEVVREKTDLAYAAG